MSFREVSFSPPDIKEEEIKEVVDTLRSGWITTGPKTKKFENMIAEYVGTERAVCLNSATAGLELTLRILGIGPGDEVITSAYTYTASASVISHVGAKVILVDTEEDSLEINYEQVRNAINENTKAIIAVDIAGVMCDYKLLKSIIEDEKNIFKCSNEAQEKLGRIALIADGAHSLGASRSDVGSGRASDFTIFSFHAVKNLTTGEGGAVVWNCSLDSEWLYNQYMLYSLHGQSKDALSKTQKGSWEYDIIVPAYKCNMTDITASIGLHQLDRYNDMLHIRKNLISRYDSELKNSSITSLNHYVNDSISSGHLYITNIPGITEENRNLIINELAKKGISSNVHYKPLPMLTAYKTMGYDIKDFPHAYRHYSSEITLPLHTFLTEDDVEYVCKNYMEIVERLLQNV